ncbi:MAG: hypothetical protein HOV68_05275 [Streptomycetaceae bacterium]|nr:hypothetical protein [Streptomycetaceae bacterium]
MALADASTPAVPPADTGTIVMAGDILRWATDKTNAVRTVVLLIAGVMVMIAILTAYWRTKSWVATGVAFLLGALVMWGIANMTILEGKVGSEINENGLAPASSPETSAAAEEAVQ